MIVRHFRTNYSIITSLVWLSLLFFIRSGVLSTSIDTNSYTVVASSILNFLNYSNTSEVFFLFLFILIISFSSYLFNDRFIIDHYRSFLPMLLAISFMCSGLTVFNLTPAHLGVVIMLLSLLPLFNLDASYKAQNNATNAGLILSMGSFIDPYLLFLSPIIWITALVFKKLNIKVFVASVIGFIIPYVLVAGILFLSNDLSQWTNQLTPKFNWLAYSSITINQGLFVLITLIGINLPFVLFNILSGTERFKIFSRKVIGIVMVIFFLNTLLLTLGISTFESFYIYSVFPLSILYSIYLNHLKPKLSNILIILIIASALLGFINEF